MELTRCLSTILDAFTRPDPLLRRISSNPQWQAGLLKPERRLPSLQINAFEQYVRPKTRAVDQ